MKQKKRDLIQKENQDYDTMFGGYYASQSSTAVEALLQGKLIKKCNFPSHFEIFPIFQIITILNHVWMGLEALTRRISTI